MSGQHPFAIPLATFVIATSLVFGAPAAAAQEDGFFPDTKRKGRAIPAGC